MSPQPIQFGGAQLDLSPRFFHTATVAASPAAATETTIASLTIAEDIAALEGIFLVGYATYTVGASGVSVNVRIRRTNTSGTIIKASGAVTAVAAELNDRAICGLDTGMTPLNQVYVLTLTVGSGAAETTVSAVTFAALVI